MFEIASVLLLVVLAVIVFGVCLLLGAPVWLGAVVASVLCGMSAGSARGVTQNWERRKANA